MTQNAPASLVVRDTGPGTGLVRQSHDAAGLVVSPSILEGRLAISDDDRPRGIAIHAGSGSGKSALIGGVVCFQDLFRGIPQLVLDPQGPLIDNLLLRLLQLPKRDARRLLARVIYVDMSGRGDRVVTFPLLFQLEGESLRDVADRFLEALRKIDPQLQSASIQGYNSLVHIGRPTLMIVAALGRPITDALPLLRQPEAHESWLSQAVAQDPSVTPAVDFFRFEYMSLRPAERLALSRSFMVKLEPFELDPVLASMFATTAPGLDLEEIARKRMTVLLDFRGETNVERRRFKTRWVYEWFLAYVRRRLTGSLRGFGFVIDELTELTNQAALEHDLFGQDLDELINVLARGRSIYLTLAHQEMFQLPPATQKTLLTCGTQILGTTADIGAAKYLAEQFVDLDPHRVKRLENVWGHDEFGPMILEERQVDFPIEEQILLGAQDLMDLVPFQFLVKKRNDPTLTRISARSLVGDLWVSDHLETLAALRSMLAATSGLPRPASASAKTSPTGHRPVDILKGTQPYGTNDNTEQVEPDFWDTGCPSPPGIPPASAGRGDS